jgi:hypothetical protein
VSGKDSTSVGPNSFGRVVIKRKITRLCKWDIICRPKYHGGVGIKFLGLKNRCLLSKWMFKLTEECVWQELLHNKYICNNTLALLHVKPTDSLFSKGLMRVKDDILK